MSTGSPGPRPKGGYRRRRWLLLAVGIAISGVALAFAFRSVDADAVTSALRRANVLLVASSLLPITAAVAIRCQRWRDLTGLESSFSSFWRATVLGYVGNVLFPARFGDLLRVAALAREMGLKSSRLLSVGILDRVWDVFGFALIGMLAWGYAGSSLGLSTVVATIVAGFIAMLAIARWTLFEPMRIHRLSRAMTALVPRRYAESARQLITSVLVPLQPALRLDALGAAAALTAVALVLDFLSIMLCSAALGWNLSALAIVWVGVAIWLVSLLPTAPGYIGVYQVGSVIALPAFGIAESEAIAFSVLLHAANLAVVALLGSWTTLQMGVDTLRAFVVERLRS